ncbi:DUF4878 domain-containing protein [Flavobacterium lindanitolerans]|jgi:hypothetical protein|uniref:Uncharacterized protein DUF4878 n=1 Tax=Flavobacterium lindanitolerans TaxID=428988 RepID=A0A497V3I7_9FLAO|nr:DUF4878 domain-containing protein [Flavobacterium lindanitolerans]MDQ7962081.1 DUF4878 domain-containing protein [Flavobacterium lindanitolerans]PKW29395.1 uncharacterized protein DUF4878 [Flavobacterium lindanitolerans]RLJ35105.1 uncharacterized protein DUF4878 [Flavobacterium lindanitolerans]
MKTNTFRSIAGKAFLILGFLSFTFFVSCSNDSNPEAVAEKFLNHVNKGEFKEAKEYCDEQTASLIGMMESMAGAKKDELKKNDAKVEIISSEVKDDKATVKYKTVGGKAEAAAEQTLNLVKVDGKWKVTIDKENANKEGAKAPGADMEATDSLAAPADEPVVPADSTETAE